MTATPGFLECVWAQLEALKDLKLEESLHSLTSTVCLLRVGAYHPQLAHLEGKRLLADNQNTLLLCARVCWSLKLEA